MEARPVLALSIIQDGPEPDRNGPRRLEVVKTNLCRNPEALGVRFEEESSHELDELGELREGGKGKGAKAGERSRSVDILAALTGILVLAGLAEALVEYLISPIVKARDENEDPIPPGSAGLNWRDLVLRYTAAGAGVALCVVYRADILVFFDLVSPWPWVGYVVTGLLIGRGSNFVHDFASRWLRQQPPLN